MSINFDVANPLDADLDIKFVQNDASVDGSIYAHFDQPFDSFVVPAKGTANSGTFGNVLLTKGALASLAIIPLGYLDIASALTVQIGVGGYEVPWLQSTQKDVPTTYRPALSISAMQSILENNSTSANVTGALSTILSAGSSIVSGVTSAVGSVVSEVTSAAGSVVSEVTSAAGSVVSEVTSVAGSVVSDVTSVAGSVAGDVASAAGGAVATATAAAGSALSGLTNALPTGI